MDESVHGIGTLGVKLKEEAVAPLIQGPHRDALALDLFSSNPSFSLTLSAYVAPPGH